MYIVVTLDTDFAEFVSFVSGQEQGIRRSCCSCVLCDAPVPYVMLLCLV